MAGPRTSDQPIGLVTPGEMLWEAFMLLLGLSGRALARQRFGASAEFWLNLQMAHDLERARRRRAA